MKKHIDLWEHAGHILSNVGNAALVTTKADGKVNTMTIGWGTIGIDWSRPVFIAYVRESRYTKQLLEANEEFTVNIPYGSTDKKILGVCGTKSGRDMNKIAELGLTLEEPERVSVPGIREFPLTLECKVIYKQKQDLSAIPQEILDAYYPVEDDTMHPGYDRDYHIAYTAQIVDAYIIEE